MPTNSVCLQQLDAVLAAIESPNDAYVARTRLRRLVLTVMRHVARRVGFEPPSLPRRLSVGAFDGANAEIVELCNGILDLSDHLCQPSEAFDSRWQAEWLLVRTGLLELRTRLANLAS